MLRHRGADGWAFIMQDRQHMREPGPTPSAHSCTTCPAVGTERVHLLSCACKLSLHKGPVSWTLSNPGLTPVPFMPVLSRILSRSQPSLPSLSSALPKIRALISIRKLSSSVCSARQPQTLVRLLDVDMLTLQYAHPSCHTVTAL